MWHLDALCYEGLNGLSQPRMDWPKEAMNTPIWAGMTPFDDDDDDDELMMMSTAGGGMLCRMTNSASTQQARGATSITYVHVICTCYLLLIRSGLFQVSLPPRWESHPSTR